ncbi:MAG: hypothetical protein ACXWFX_09630 [Methylobacter sp.]
MEIQLKRQGHDRCFEREQRERKRGINQRSDRRPDITKTRAAGHQVDIDVIAGRVITDRETGDENNQADGQDGPERIGKAVVNRQEAADGFQDQE